MASGLVKWFNAASGYGFIAPDQGGKDLYVRRASVSDDVDLTLVGLERVAFESREGGMGPEAINVLPFAGSEECDHCSLEPVDLAGARAPSGLGANAAGFRTNGRRP
jgi:CspA family cold shock protein